MVDIPTTGGYTEYSSAPWWKHGASYGVTVATRSFHIVLVVRVRELLGI